MRLRIANTTDENLRISMQYGLWGSEKNQFNKWEIGDYLVMKVEKSYVALLKITGPHFEDNLMIWESRLFPFRIPVEFIQLLDNGDKIDHDPKIKELFLKHYGHSYGWTILNKTLLHQEISECLLNEFKNKIK